MNINPGDILSLYESVDFKFFPECVEKLYSKRDTRSLIILKKLSYVLKYYKLYTETFEQRTPRKIEIIDVNDLYAYMLMNSDLEIKVTKEINYSLSIFNELDYKLLFLERIVKEKEMFFLETSGVIKNEHSKIKEKINLIFQFRKITKPIINKNILFLDDDFKVIETTIYDIYSRLHFDEQYEFAKLLLEDSTDHNLQNRSGLFIIIYKLIRIDYTIPKSVSNKHPMLLGLRGEIHEIIDFILQDIDETTVMDKLKSYAKIISNSFKGENYKKELKYLKEKCFKALEGMKRTMTCLTAGDFFRDGRFL